MKTIFFLIPLVLILFNSCNQESVNQFNVLDYGAVPDGKTLNTAALQTAIDAATEQGGGEVVVPPGNYLTGTVFIKDNVTLNVMSGATILGSPDIEDYTEMTWGHNKDRQPWHLIMAKKASNIEIKGGGTIDGNGQAYWKNFEPDSLPMWIMAKDKKVSPMMEIEGCRDVRIKDVTLLTGGGWTLHLYNSDHCQVSGIKILNNLFSPNGDGIDITGCFDVTISDCIIKTCDDAICLKTTADSRECKRVAVTNCVIECLCAALKIGNESFRDISQATFSNCVIYGSSRAFGIYAESAGTVSDIIVSNIVADTRSPLIYNRPLHISLRKGTKGSGGSGDYMQHEDKQYDFEGREARLRNVQISNFICQTEGRILITAEDGMMIENLTLRDIHLTYPWIEDPFPWVDRAKSKQFSPMNPDARIARAALVAENVSNLVVDHFTVGWPETETVPEEWAFPKRIANGTLDAFYHDYSSARQTEFSAIWGRGLEGGYIHAPGVSPSSPVMKNFDIKNSSIEYRISNVE